LIFEGIGELLGGLTMIFTSSKIKDPALVDMMTTSCFMVAILIIFIGSMYENLYVIVVGTVVLGFSDCSCAVLGLSLAGRWKKKGITTFNLFQNLSGAGTMTIMIFTPVYVTVIWISTYYLTNITLLFLYRRKNKMLKK
jgi:hypothetical protein